MPDNTTVGVAPQILQDLAPFLLVTAEETLTLVLETLTVLLKVGKGQWLAPDLAGSLANALLDVWQKNVKGILNITCLNILLMHSFRSCTPFRCHRCFRVPCCCIVPSYGFQCPSTSHQRTRLCLERRNLGYKLGARGHYEYHEGCPRGPAWTRFLRKLRPCAVQIHQRDRGPRYHPGNYVSPS